MAAIAPQCFKVLVVADLETLKQERCFQPRTVQLRDVHANAQILHGDLTLHMLSLPPSYY